MCHFTCQHCKCSTMEHHFFQGGAIYVDSGKLKVKGSNFTRNKVGHEFINKDGKNCSSGNLFFNSQTQQKE